MAKFTISYGSTQIGAFELNPRNVDEKTIAERKWNAPTKAPAPQKPCDHGLFSDDSKQTDLF